MKRFVFIALLVGSAISAHAQLDYDNLSTYTGQGYLNDGSSNFIVFNEITLGSTSPVASVSFITYNSSSSSITSSAELFFYNANGSSTTSLGTEIAGYSISSLGTQASHSFYSDTIALSSPLSLSASTLWVGVEFSSKYEAIGSGSTPAVGSASGNILYGNNGTLTTAGSNSAYNFALSLTPTPSPEPFTLALSGAGLATAIARRYRKSKTN